MSNQSRKVDKDVRLM